MFTLVGLMEFFYKEAPTAMRSLSTSFSWLSLSIGYFLSSAFVELIGVVTRKASKSKTGWLDGIDMNKNHLELFYRFLAILSLPRKHEAEPEVPHPRPTRLPACRTTSAFFFFFSQIRADSAQFAPMQLDSCRIGFDSR